MSHRQLTARPGLIARSAIALLLTAATIAARADNAALQDLFFAACDSPAGNLATRCAETPGGLGDLSGESESSLNPSQTLSGTRATHSRARDRTEDALERGERSRSNDGENALTLGPFSLLVNGHYLDEDLSRTVDVDAERGYQLGAWGAQLGVDYRVSATLVTGALVSWESSDLDFDREQPGVEFTPQGRAGTIEQDSLGIAVFANLLIGEHTHLDVSAGYLDSDYTLTRRAVFQESGRTVPQTLAVTRGTPDGDEFWGAASLGYSTTAANWSVDPYLGVTYSRAKIDGYDETDQTASGLAMSMADIESRSVLGQAGVRMSRAVSRTGYVLLPQISAEYLREFERDGADTRVSYQLDQRGTTLALAGDRRDADYFDLGVGLVLLLPNGWMPFFEYRATVGHRDLDRQRIALGLRVEL